MESKATELPKKMNKEKYNIKVTYKTDGLYLIML